ncbi:MAG TPA: phosphate acetyltransferase [Candidatus Cloacimonas sp.]|jgi:phosphate acetyltransferase|nr:phosphate acetyltransferase [Candidatus Cloacimonas sp.]MCK9164709.1 phosphate acetyltransferase [Candidatus Cloacimonas sp.]HOU25976.1 phosphate acetyltransferase [Candidatus Cloacimonas sp.]HQB49409.1 phosphate acetyltransferase [Candidatus Cloacimonas sp.]HQM16905.1 phosphate acetyltransferase [Candidatus Cloacimonas sp.]
MFIIDEVKKKAKKTKGSVVLPESSDPRVLIAAAQIVKEDLAKIILLGKEEKISEDAKALNLDLNGVTIINPETSEYLSAFADAFYLRRKHKGVNPVQALETVKDPLYFGASLVKQGKVSGMVAGAANTTADVLRAALQVIGVMPGLKTVSSTFIMPVPDFRGEPKVFLFADCAVVPNPTAEQLADIAICTALTRKAIIGDEPKVALLSFSTLGSANDELVDKVISAKAILDERKVDFEYDGELQLDAALIPEVAIRKAPQSPIAGKANTLIFPDLQAGNIGYKLVQYIGKVKAIGPIIQGLAAPASDLSRGCSYEDIVNTVAYVLLLAAQQKYK